MGTLDIPEENDLRVVADASGSRAQLFINGEWADVTGTFATDLEAQSAGADVRDIQLGAEDQFKALTVKSFFSKKDPIPRKNGGAKK